MPNTLLPLLPVTISFQLHFSKTLNNFLLWTIYLITLFDPIYIKKILFSFSVHQNKDSKRFEDTNNLEFYVVITPISLLKKKKNYTQFLKIFLNNDQYLKKVALKLKRT